MSVSRVDGASGLQGGLQQRGTGIPTVNAAKSANPGTFDNLPEGIIVHIFTFLPIRDLTRSECVSKQWRQSGKIEKQNRIKAFNEDTRSIEDMIAQPTAEQQKCLKALKNSPPNDIGQDIQMLRPKINKQVESAKIDDILRNAAITNKIDDALLALIFGADIDQADPLGVTPLYRAAFKGHTDIVKVLIGAGADVNKADHLKVTPLFGATFNSHTEIVKALLAAGADVNQLSLQKIPALYWPAHNGHTEIVKALLEAGAGAYVNQANLAGETPLSVADANGHAEIVDMLKKAAQDRE